PECAAAGGDGAGPARAGADRIHGRDRVGVRHAGDRATGDRGGARPRLPDDHDPELPDRRGRAGEHACRRRALRRSRPAHRPAVTSTGRALDIAAVLPASGRTVARRGEWSRFAANRRALAGAIVLVALAASALLSPVLAPYDPTEQRAGAVAEPPSVAHP